MLRIANKVFVKFAQRFFFREGLGFVSRPDLKPKEVFFRGENGTPIRIPTPEGVFALIEFAARLHNKGRISYAVFCAVRNALWNELKKEAMDSEGPAKVK